MVRIGFDVGGSKIAAIALDGRGAASSDAAGATCRATTRGPSPRSSGWCEELVRAHGPAVAVGVAMPGMIGAGGELIRVVNLPWVEGRPLRQDLEQAIAACRSRSPTTPTASRCPRRSTAPPQGRAWCSGRRSAPASAAASWSRGRPLAGANAIAGEWGHNPLPLLDPADRPAVVCGCGRTGCIETWLNGAALARDFAKVAGRAAEAPEIVRLAEEGDLDAQAVLAAYRRRLAAALAGVVNLLDPEVIVLGGGLSALPGLYDEVPRLWQPLIVAPAPRTRLVPARFGAESGLRGAAWLG